MRTEYVEQIKTFLRDTPNFKERLEEMRLEALISGATEEEFEAAVEALAPGTLGPPIPKKLRPFTKKLVAFDVVVHVLFIVSAIGSISLVATVMTTGGFPHLLTNASRQTPTTPMEEDQPAAIIPKVYANTAIVNGEKIFSVPASNVTLEVTGTPKREVFAFSPYWMMDVQDKISYTGITTVSFFGLETDGAGNIITDYDDGQPDKGWLMWNDPAIDIAVKRAKQERVKTQLTIKAFQNTNIEQLVVSDEAQKTFIANAVHLVNTKALDGLNLDFEYIGTPTPETRDNFTRLIRNLRAELTRQVPKAQLTLATYVSAGAEPGLFDLEMLSPYIDSFVIMGYDFHTPKGNPGPVAPLTGAISIHGFIQQYLDKVPPEKLILALAHYGYDWPVNEKNQAIAPAGVLSYAEIAALAESTGTLWDETAQTPYIEYIDPKTSQRRIVHFENTRSLGLKYDYINEENLGGVGIWALGYDGLNNDLRSVLMQKFAK